MKRKLVPTGNLAREEWLELRRRGIGGSDASVIMGKNPYRSILQLWEEKTGKAPITEVGNEAAYWGTVMEPIVRKEFTRRTGLKVRQKHFMIFHPEIPYMFADVDGIVTEENGEKCIFEAKTVSQYKEKQWETGIPEEYMLQVQHYLEVCGMEKAYVAALIGGNRFVFRTIMRDEGLIMEILEKEKEFWEGHVITGIVPEADSSKATGSYLDEKYKKTVADIIQLPLNMKEVLRDYAEVDSRMKKLEKEKQGLSNRIKAAMEEHETGEVDGMVVQWKRIEKESLDSKKLKLEKPEVFSKYRSVSAYRRLSVAS